MSRRNEIASYEYRPCFLAFRFPFGAPPRAPCTQQMLCPAMAGDPARLPAPLRSCLAARWLVLGSDRPEDLDTGVEDHAADETRCACISRPWTAMRLELEKPTNWLGYSARIAEAALRHRSLSPAARRP